jgi:hypothetical protein
LSCSIFKTIIKVSKDVENVNGLRL